jgi:molybdopterin-containing oxidoreductase family molybdopterin binding subunit
MDSTQKMVYTACPGWGCHDYCVLSTFVNEDGVIDHIEPFVVPERIANSEKQPVYGSLAHRSGICAKGAASAKFPYIKERLRYPMKRVGERNSGQWERLSWDQALAEIAAQIKEVQQKYGPEAVLMSYFPSGIPAYQSSLGWMLEGRFRETIGASEMEMEAIDLVGTFGPAYWNGKIHSLSICNADRSCYADYLVIWGGNPFGCTKSNITTRVYSDLKDQGVKIVNIGVLFDATAANSTQFIGIKPASDAAFAFAVAKIIIETGRYNEDFLLAETNAPFLVREDTGKFLRESDVIPGGSNCYMVWDKTEQAYVAVGAAADIARGDAPAVFLVPFKSDVQASDETEEGLTNAVAGDENIQRRDIDLFAEVTIGGIACKTALTKVRQRVSPYTPEYQEHFTNVPAQTVRQFAEEYLSHKNALIQMGLGLRYKNSAAVGRAVALLPMLTGYLNNDSIGITIEPSNVTYPTSYNSYAVQAEGLPSLPSKLVVFQDVLDSFLDPSRQQYKAIISVAGNYVHNWPPRRMWRDEIIPNLDLFVVFDIRMTETCMFADYILPCQSTFEREEFIGTGNCLVHCAPAIAPVGESRHEADIFADLAKHLGYEQYWNKTQDEWRAMWLNTTDPAVATVEPKITVERLRAETIIELNNPKEPYHIYRDETPGTPSGRYEFYVEELVGIPGGPIVDREPALIDNDEQRRKYPMHLFLGRSRFFMQGQFREIEELDRLCGDGPRVGLSKDDAAARGIREGDIVEVFNDRGFVRLPARFVNFLPPGMAHVWYAYGVDRYKEYDSEPSTELGAYDGVGEAAEPVSLAWNTIMRQRLLDSGAPDGFLNTSGLGGTETIWDVLCDIRRAE